MFGASDWNRTSDTLIFSQVLYQLSYGRICILESDVRPKRELSTFSPSAIYLVSVVGFEPTVLPVKSRMF